ncbi:MAG: 3-phosphoshikimate 1-carboxyvinyltransferase [Lachnospiraceae bacterium]
MNLRTCSKLEGSVFIPGDKSISHRAIMFGAIANGKTTVKNFLQGADCLSTIACFRSMGIEIENESDIVTVHGKGLHGLKAPYETLDVGNSGTTTRLISGILSGQSFSCELNGDESIQKRPMKRILEPLRLMNADVKSKLDNNCTPLLYAPSTLCGITYHTPVASAQIKSCLLLAGLYADSPTTVIEPTLSRNHTELMLRAFGADLRTTGTSSTIYPASQLYGQEITVPGDISSAAYFIAAGLLLPGPGIRILNVGVNPTRDGILRVLEAMGAKIIKENERIVQGEPVADLYVEHSHLTGVKISGSIIPSLIDEIPILAVLAAFADGTTEISDAKELRVKETDRVLTVCENLSRMGVQTNAKEDGMTIFGGVDSTQRTIIFDSFLDHRIAMAFSVAALALNPDCELNDAKCVDISYPNFYKDLYALISE